MVGWLRSRSKAGWEAPQQSVSSSSGCGHGHGHAPHTLCIAKGQLALTSNPRPTPLPEENNTLGLITPLAAAITLMRAGLGAPDERAGWQIAAVVRTRVATPPHTHTLCLARASPSPPHTPPTAGTLGAGNRTGPAWFAVSGGSHHIPASVSSPVPQGQ